MERPDHVTEDTRTCYTRIKTSTDPGDGSVKSVPPAKKLAGIGASAGAIDLYMDSTLCFEESKLRISFSAPLPLLQNIVIDPPLSQKGEFNISSSMF